MGKCSHGLTSKECLVCASPMYGEHPPRAVPSDKPVAWMCPAHCGCLWRDNGDGSMSLFGPNSKSCRICEFLPLNRLLPLYAQPAAQAVPAAEACWHWYSDEEGDWRLEGPRFGGLVEGTKVRLYDQATVVRLQERAERAEAELAACRAALGCAAAAIGDAIYTEDGLDGDSGQRFLHIITEARERGTFDKEAYGDLDALCPFARAERAEEELAALRAQPAAQAVPLTPRQLDSLIEKFVGGAELTDDEYDSMRQFAAEVERAHGITAQAVPLTDEQIRLIADSSGGLITGHTPGAIHLARAIERAHGIAAREVKPQ